jgi:DNA-binding PadR family transcriptional regulator
LILYAGFIRLHILHHAAQEPIFGLGIIQELERHGYRLSAGTLYPILRSAERRVGRTVRRLYRATAAGKRALAEAKIKLRELTGELLQEEG